MFEVTCDPKNLILIPQGLIEALEQKTNGKFLSTVSEPISEMTPHSLVSDTLTRCWTFEGGKVASGCSDYLGWFAWLGKDLLFWSEERNELESLPGNKTPGTVTYLFLSP